jgi:electron transfer flavoprotein beta subunit
MNIVVLAKQVPDTRQVAKDSMNEDGTIKRSALPAIFNPEDLNALEMALHIKDIIAETQITVLTMGPARAADLIRDALYRGADKGILLSDKYFAGSDTLATSYAIALAIQNIGNVNLVLSGRQAIDGDTAQVGPQTAEKLHFPQITYAEEVIAVSDKNIVIKRRLERGTEIVKSPLPCLITVHSSASACRSHHAKKLMRFKKAMTISEYQEKINQGFDAHFLEKKPFLKIEEWKAVDIHAEIPLLGLSGSPTKVKKIDNVVFATKETHYISNSQESIDKLAQQLASEHLLD